MAEHGDKLTPSQTASMLGITTRTLRRWSIEFRDYLSPTARRKGRKRFFDGSDFEMMQRVQSLMTETGSYEATRANLPDRDVSTTTKGLTLAPEVNIAIGEALEKGRHLEHVAVDHEQRLRTQEDHVKELERQIRFLRWRSLPWWQRFREPPPE